MNSLPEINSDSNCLTPLHIAAGTGNTSLWETIIDMVEEIEPKDEYGGTPLHNAAQNGYLETYKSIVGKIKDINPRCHENGTPYHWAAHGGQLEMCLFIMKQLEDKNPSDNGCKRLTPLHYAAQAGHLHICKAIKGRYQELLCYQFFVLLLCYCKFWYKIYILD